ncbi:MAG: hypothetical protein KGJ23_14355 [Euryarchaeota archaeon]|nr:hypothetical protein [Euryarchaeota archaeon]
MTEKLGRRRATARPCPGGPLLAPIVLGGAYGPASGGLSPRPPTRQLPILVGILAILIGIIGFFVLLGGLLLLLAGLGVALGYRFFGQGAFGSDVLAGGFYFILGIVMLATARGLWDLEFWALVLTILVVSLLLIGSYFVSLFLFIIFLILLIYLVLVRRHFS